MGLHYLFDGYNIIHCIDLFSGASLEIMRTKLIKYLTKKKPQGKNRATVVFDGKEEVIDYPIGTPLVKVIFTHQMSADDYIIREIEKSANPRLVVVISNDREICERANLLGAKVVSVREFFKPERKKVEKRDKNALSFEELREIKEELIKRKISGFIS